MTVITPRKRSYYFTKGGHGSSVDRKNEDDSDEYDDSHQKGYEDYTPCMMKFDYEKYFKLICVCEEVNSGNFHI